MRLRQIALVGEDLAAAEADIRAILGLDYAYDDPGVGEFGLKNAVFPVGETFLEVVSPKQEGTTAGRLLEKRGGDGGYMAIFQVHDIEPARARIEAAGARTVARYDRDNGVRMSHIHPRDIGAAIVSVDQMPTWEHWEWGGKIWRENMRTDVSTAITGVELQGDDPEALAKRWGEILGFAPVKTGGGWKIDLPDGGEIRFVVATDGRGEGLGRFDVAVKDPDAVRATAKARGKLGEGGDVILSGTRVRLVQG
jgi:catechol 2,3-dioxygenase-like lactoylglutathione lyase family enzyme